MKIVVFFSVAIETPYRDAEVWIALDQDTTHPCKSKETRRLMRRLKLHWISLPKASPDDNPAETIFSECN